MQRLFNTRMLAVLLLAFGVAACDDEATTPPTSPDPIPTVTETFTGAVTASGGVTHTFSVSAGGAITATLKSIGDDNTLVVSFALGNWNGTSCSIVLANDAATGGTVLTGTMTAAGTLCARVGDVGNIAAGKAAAYTIEVVHP